MTAADSLVTVLAEHARGGYFATPDGHRECYCGHVLAEDETYDAHLAIAIREDGYVHRDRVEAAVRLISPDHITPMGARQIRAVLTEEKP